MGALVDSGVPDRGLVPGWLVVVVVGVVVVWRVMRQIVCEAIP